MAYTLEKYADGYLDQDDGHHDSPASWLWITILGGCGCGSSDELAEKAVELLDIFSDSENRDRRDVVYKDLTYETLAHWFDSAGLIEHGTAIRGSWLTNKGKEIHTAIALLR